MTQELLVGLMGFAIATLFSPGPNNLMLMASGLNFGFVKTLPHLLGVTIGFTLMVAGVGIGVNRIFDAWPPSYTIMQVLSLLYLLYLTYRIATQTEISQSTTQRAKPLSFLQAALFQWVNPKAWAMAVSATSIYTPPDGDFVDSLILASVFLFFASLSSTCWTLIGLQLKRFLSGRTKLRIFNISCAVLILLSVVPIFFAQ